MRTYDRVHVVTLDRVNGVMVRGTAKKRDFAILACLTFGDVVVRHLCVLLCCQGDLVISRRVAALVHGSFTLHEHHMGKKF